MTNKRKELEKEKVNGERRGGSERLLFFCDLFEVAERQTHMHNTTKTLSTRLTVDTCSPPLIDTCRQSGGSFLSFSTFDSQ